MPRHIADLVNDDEYMKVAKSMRRTCASIRRRALVSTIHRWHQESGRGNDVTYVEVGVKYGSLTECVLTYCDFITLAIAIDPYEEYPEGHRDRGQFGYANRDQPSWDWLYKRATQILSKHGERVRLLRDFSIPAAQVFKAQGRTFPLVYLDAMHAYDDVLADCRAWWPLVEPGGMLCLDDYYDHSNWRRETTGVSQAADDFAASVGLRLVGLHRTAYIQKPG
jgi:hypothetical protein